MVDNSVTLVGNLTDDPELRFTQNGTAVANMRVAVNRRIRNRDGEFEDRTDGFFNVVVWRNQAENTAESLTKGARVLVTGRLTERSYQTRDGENRYVTEIEADEVCPSLRWATATITRNSRASGNGAPARGAAAGGAPAGDSQAGAGYGGESPSPQTAPEPDDVPF